MKNKANAARGKQSPVNVYDDGNIPDVDMSGKNSTGHSTQPTEPLPESSRPRKDGPGGD